MSSRTAIPALPADLAAAVDAFRPHAPSPTVAATAGRCVTISAAFAELCAARGLDAFVSEPFGPDEFGYRDRPRRGLSTHSVTIADTDAGVFYIDWTAAQYGYTEMPKITVGS